MLRTEIVHLLIAERFQEVTLAILPLSALAGAIRNLRAHFGDQVFLLHNRTRLLMMVAGIDAVVSVIFGIAFIWQWGVVGGAVASVAAAACAATASFSIGFSKFGLTLPLGHLTRIAIATAAMAGLLNFLPPATNFIALAGHIAAGAALYPVVLAILYGPFLAKTIRLRAQHSG
jgi:hypothetical protein